MRERNMNDTKKALLAFGPWPLAPQPLDSKDAVQVMLRRDQSKVEEPSVHSLAWGYPEA